jgi:tRNA A-37 threonylcarbamoyl transferase component Bud32
MYKEHDLLKREIFILKKLQKYDCFPKIVYYNNILLVTEYIGDFIKKESIPDNILFQINDINNILIKEKIIHSDIKQNEMLIKDNKLYIVDFGWARYHNIWSCNSGFSYKIKPNIDNTRDLQSLIYIDINLFNNL